MTWFLLLMKRLLEAYYENSAIISAVVVLIASKLLYDAIHLHYASKSTKQKETPSKKEHETENIPNETTDKSPTAEEPTAEEPTSDETTSVKTTDQIQYKEMKLQLYLAFLILIAHLGCYFVGRHIHSTTSLVPELFGRTYDDAMDSLYTNGLNGQLLMSSSNSDFANSDSRVVWQSEIPNISIKRNTVVYFVIDDSFSLKSVPLDQYLLSKEQDDHPEILTYHCYQCKYLTENGELIEEQDLVKENERNKDAHWNIRIEDGRWHTNVTSKITGGVLKNAVDYRYIYSIYAGSLTVTLEDIIEKSLSAIAEINKDQLDKYTIVGKLIPINESSKSGLQETALPNHSGSLFLPKTIQRGEYTFAFSIIDPEGGAFDWHHSITIIEG